MKRSILLLILAVVFIFMQIDPLGFDMVAGSSGYFFRVNSSLINTLIAPILVLFILFYPRGKMKPIDNAFVGIGHRFCAFLIDFFLLMAVVTPFLTLPFLWFEQQYTDIFLWSFTRTFSRKTDMIMWVIFPFIFALIYYYFYKHAQKNKATLGQYIMKYKIISNVGDRDIPNFHVRTFQSFVAYCLWPITLYKYWKDDDGIFWWDENSNTRAVRVDVSTK